MASAQIAVRIPEDLLRRLDELIATGAFPSRAAAVRAGIEAVAEAERRRAIDEAIVEGYRRIPPTPQEEAAAWESARQAILEEPW